MSDRKDIELIADKKIITRCESWEHHSRADSVMNVDGELKEGDALPSVRQVAADFQLNPITVSKAYQELVDENLVEKRRGLGMYVNDGAREALLKAERERFLSDEWPALRERLKRLGLDLHALFGMNGNGGHS